jgi:hypothetical protein
MDNDALLVVCRTAHRRSMAETGGNIPAAKEAVRFELQRAGFEAVDDDHEMPAGMATVIVVLADGHYVQRDSRDNWTVRLHAPPGSPDEGDDPIPAGSAADW